MVVAALLDPCRATAILILLVSAACGGQSDRGNAAAGSTGAVASAGSSESTTGGAGSDSGAGASAAGGAGSESGAGAGSGSGAVAGAGAVAGTGSPSAGIAAGASLTGSSSGVNGSGGSGSPPPPPHPGNGCGKPPVGAVSTAFTSHMVTIPPCGTGSVNSDCIAAPFAPGGVSSRTNAGEDYTHRDYAIELPDNYDPSTPYPVFFGGGGCGGSPPQMGGGLNVGATGAILVGLSYVQNCFADGGSACAGGGSVDACVNGPELPYFRAVLADVEAQYCVAQGNVFIGGTGSGAWEAMTLGCGGANLLRGFSSYEGGKREHQPACAGPTAGFMVVRSSDTANPVGPLATVDPDLDSYGSAPERDDLLMRNGCVGTATAPYDSQLPLCVTYTGCPATYPVVWCNLPGSTQNGPSENGVNYASGMWKFLSALPPLP